METGRKRSKPAENRSVSSSATQSADNVASEILRQLNDQSIGAIYRDKVRSQRTRRYELRIPRNSPTIDIMHTLLGIELKVGKVRMLCPDLATARYLSVFARIGCEEVAIPYDITQISWIADELESSWHRMMLLVEHFTRGRTARLRSLVRRKLLTQVKESVLAAGAGSKFPHFSQPARRQR